MAFYIADRTLSKGTDRKPEALCLELGIDYYIKDDLRKEMEKP